MMKWIRRHKKKLLLCLLGLGLLLPILGYAGFQYAKSRFLRETPNRLSLEGELHPVEFTWVPETFSDDYSEPHSAILLPVTVPGVSKQLYMQFDTGAPSTFLRSGCVKSLQDRGVECELYKDDKTTRVKKFELNVGKNHVVLDGGWVMQRDISIDWDKPYNVIGSIGADFIADVVCAIDFPAEKIHLYRSRPESLSSLGSFQPFEFTGRRVLLPTTIDDTEMQVLWDSGCSSFGLFTSKYFFDDYSDPDEPGIQFGAMRFGDTVPAYHKPCDLIATFGETKIPVKRVSYLDMYAGLQTTFGRFTPGGFLGNKSLTESTLILDTTVNEFFVLDNSLPKGP
ncbi:MAG: hypothetical protein AB8G99_21780 [Planctomycetaceae bacterium]